MDTPKCVKCQICFFKCISTEDLLRHIVRSHREHPKLQLCCKYRGCNAKFKMWKSFQRHFSRKHKKIPLVNNDINRNYTDGLDNNSRISMNNVDGIGISTAERHHTGTFIIIAHFFHQYFYSHIFNMIINDFQIR